MSTIKNIQRKKKKLSKTQVIAHTGVMTALYIVLTIFVQIPIANQISVDLGYVVLGVAALYLPGWSCAVIGGAGCIAKALSLTGSFPMAWFPSNLLLGFLLGQFIGKGQNRAKRDIVSVIAVFACIGGLKTLISFVLYQSGTSAIFVADIIASISDSAALLLGYFVGGRFLTKVLKGKAQC